MPRTHELLHALESLASADRFGPAEVATRLAAATSDVCVVFDVLASQLEVLAVAADDGTGAGARDWDTVFSAPIDIQVGSLGEAFIIDRPLSLPNQPWPTSKSPEAKVLLRAFGTAVEGAGIIALVRKPSAPDFSSEEFSALSAAASFIGHSLEMDRARHLEAFQRKAIDVIVGGLSLFHSEFGIQATLRRLTVHARHVLGASRLAIVLDAGDGAQRLEALAGAHPGDLLEGTLDPATVLRLEAVLEQRQATTFLDLPSVDPIRVFDTESQVLALPMGPGGLGSGALIVSWPRNRALQPAERTLAEHVTALAASLLAQFQMTKHANEARAAERLSTQLAEARDRIVRQMAHDLRNPLNAIGLAAEEIEIVIDDKARVRSALGAIYRQVEFLSAHLRERMRAIEDSVNPAPRADLGEALERLHKVSLQTLAEGRTLKIVKPDATSLNMLPLHLDQVLERLLAEAARHSGPKGTLEAWVAVSDGWALTFLEDDGPGLDLDTQNALLPRFGAPAAAGGLRAVSDLVAALGGHFGFRSKPGGRTTFYFGLPTSDWGDGQVD